MLERKKPAKLLNEKPIIYKKNLKIIIKKLCIYLLIRNFHLFLIFQSRLTMVNRFKYTDSLNNPKEKSPYAPRMDNQV